MVGRVSDQREIVTGGIRLAYRVAGDPGAPPMVLLHALGENSTDWAGVTGPLAASFRVFALDLRGHGDSDWPGTYSFQLMRDDVIGALDGLGLNRITAPTLLIGGGEASHIPQDKLTAVAARIPGCQLVTIPAGHHVHTSRPAEFTRAVLGWLRPGPAA